VLSKHVPVTIKLAHTPLPSLRTHYQSSRRRARFEVTFTAAALVGFAALVLLLYSASCHAFIGNSDGATVVLEGQSMSTGNLLLHHWALSLDSFWIIDAPFYMVAVLIAGVRPLLLHLVPAVIAATVVVTGSLLARQGRRGVPGIAAVATVVALLGFPSHVLSVFLLQGPLHVGTVLWCLLAFAGLRHGRLGWGWVAAVLLFAASALGDLQMVALGMVPALIGGVLAMMRRRHWRSGITTAIAPVVGLLLAGTVRLVANALGTFTVARPNPIAPPSQILPNMGRVATWGAHMLGLGGGVFGDGAVPALLEAVHALGVVAVVAGVLVAAIGLIRGVRPGHRLPVDPSEGWRLDDLLVVGFVADLVVFVVLTTGNDANFSRYLTGAVVFAAVLAGRALGQMFDAVESSRIARGCGILGLGVLAAFGAGVAFNVTAAVPDAPYQALGQFLESHHLDRGIGDYWSASITTVATSGSVAVRPVVADPADHLVRYERQSTAAWYVGQSFQFLVYDTALPWGGVTSASAAATFGPIAHTYSVGPYRVLVWGHRLSVSANARA
jgi:hypothetical protein